MRLALTFVAALLVAYGLPSTPQVLAEQTCIRQDEDTVALSGILKRITYPGPPNYASVRRGDAPEAYFFLRLPTPICTAPNEITDGSRGVRTIQLVLDSTGYARLSPLVNRQVTLRGTVYDAITGHYHTPVAMAVIW